MRQAVTATLEAESAPAGRVHVLITDRSEMQRLNREFRGIDRPTDVLTFPAPDEAEGELGDIALSHEFAAEGGRARGVSASQEAAALAMHGALHLAGWTDDTDDRARAMMKRMADLAPLAGLKPIPEWSSQPH